MQRVILYYDIKHLFTMLSPGNINFCISNFVFTALTWFAELLLLTQVQNVRTTVVPTMCSLLHNQKIWMELDGFFFFFLVWHIHIILYVITITLHRLDFNLHCVGSGITNRWTSSQWSGLRLGFWIKIQKFLDRFSGN